MKKRQLLKAILPTFLLLMGLYIFPIQIFETDFSKIPGDLGDARFNNYILEHGHRYLTGEVSSFWDAPFMYPKANIIAYSDNLLGTLPMYSLVRALGFDRETSYQAWIFILFVLNFIVCYFVLKKWSGNIYLAGAGAYLFAFSISLLGQMNHIQNHPRFAIPLVFYFGWLYLKDKNLKYFLFTTLLTVYQFYCGMYLGFFVIYTLMFFIVAYLIVYRDWIFFKQFLNIKVFFKHAAVIFLALIAIAPLMIPYLETQKELGYRIYADILPTIPTASSYFFSSDASLIWKILSEHLKIKTEFWWYHQLFTGILPWIAILLSPIVLLSGRVNKPEKLFIAFLLIAFLLNILFALNFNGYSLYYFIHNLPGFGSLRSINRVINSEILLFSLLLVFVFKEIGVIKPRLTKFYFILPLLVVFENLVIGENVGKFDKVESQQQVSKIEENIIKRKITGDKPIAYMPESIPEKFFETQINVMLACQNLNLNCVNGYSGTNPPALRDFLLKGNDTSLKNWFDSCHIAESSVEKVYEEGPEILSKRLINLVASNGNFVCSDHGQGDYAYANRQTASGWETFTFVLMQNQKCAFMDDNNNYFCSEIMNNTEISASRKERKNWETFSVIKIDDEHLALKADNGKFVVFDETSLQLFAKSDSIGKNEIFRIIFR